MNNYVYKEDTVLYYFTLFNNSICNILIYLHKKWEIEEKVR